MRTTLILSALVTEDPLLLIGPQDQRMLEKVAPGLDLTVDYGWLTAIAKPIFWLLPVLGAVSVAMALWKPF